MFPRKINQSLSLTLLASKHARPLFELTNRNRDFLSAWLPWIDYTVQVEDTEHFINDQHKLYGEKKAVQAAIKYKDNIVGIVAYHEIESENDVGRIGYWLGEEYNGHGYMTLAVKEMVSIGFNDYGLNRVEIQCATENVKSRAIPESLGFVQEGTLRGAEKVNGNYLDLVVYGLLKNDAKF